MSRIIPALCWIFFACAPPLFTAEKGNLRPSDLDRQVERLASPALEDRAQAEELLVKSLSELERQEKLDILRGALKRLAEAREQSADPQVKDRLALILEPYRTGGTIWEQRLPHPGVIHSMDGKLLVCMDPLYWGTPHWTGVYETSTGNPVKPVPGVFHRNLLDAKEGRGYAVRFSQEGRSEMECYELDDGKERWTLPVSWQPSVFRLEGGKILAADVDLHSQRPFLGCHDPETGKRLWTRAEIPGNVAACRVFGEQVVAGGNFRDPGSPEDSPWMGCYALRDGKPLWERKDGPLSHIAGGWMEIAPIEKGVLARISEPPQDDGAEWQRFRLYDWGTGKVLWEFRVPGTDQIVRLRNVDAMIQIDGSRMAFLSESKRSELHLYNLDNGKLTWKIRLESTPRLFKIHKGKIILAGGNENRGWARAYDVESGKMTWTTRLAAAPWAGEISGDVVFLGGKEWLGGVDAATGKELWRASADFPFPIRQIRLHGGLIYVACFGQEPGAGWLGCFRAKGVMDE